MMESTAFLLLLLVSARFLPGGKRRRKSRQPLGFLRQVSQVPEQRWPLSRELALALTAGLVLGLVGSFGVAPLYIDGGALNSDLYDFCGSVAAMREGDHDLYSPSRSFLVGWLPALLASRWGIVDGLGISGTLSLCVLGSGLYLWARSLHSRFAGLLAVAFVFFVAPVVTLGRTLTFYPQYIAVFVLNAGACCLALRFRSWKTLLFGASVLGLVLLIDVRGLVWAVAAFPVLLLALFLSPRPEWRRGSVALVLPLLLSWFGAQGAFNERSTSLAHQANPVRHFYENGSPEGGGLPEVSRGELPQFVWGHSSFKEVPGTLLMLASDTHEVAPLMRDLSIVKEGRERHLEPLFGLAWAAGLMSLFALRRYRYRLVALGLTGLPFAAAVYYAMNVEFHPRFAASGLPILPLLLGLGVATIWGASPSIEANEHTRVEGDMVSVGPPRPRVLKASLQWGLLGLLFLGIVPSRVSPQAYWRYPFRTGPELELLLEDVEALSRAGSLGTEIIRNRAGDQLEACLVGLAQDASDGIDPHGGLYLGVSEADR